MINLNSIFNNMAYRYDHSFGLMETEEKNIILKKMHDLYLAYELELTDIEINKKFNIGNITVKQLREEIKKNKQEVHKIIKNDIIKNKNLETNFYPETQELLISMAIRRNHDFGILSFDEQQNLLEKMKNLYLSYIEKLTNEEIAIEFNENIVTIKQIREEVEGNGFFKPHEALYYRSFLR